MTPLFEVLLLQTSAAAPAPTETLFDAKFWNGIFNTIVDKGLIAGAIVWVGFQINKAIERFKSEQALRAAWAQRKLDNIGEVWQKIAEWEAHIDVVISDYHRASAGAVKSQLPGIQAALGQNVMVLLNESDAIRGVVRKDRFWTGEDVYSSFCEYCEEICSELHSIAPNDEETVNAVERNLSTSRLDAARILDRILYESRSPTLPRANELHPNGQSRQPEQ